MLKYRKFATFTIFTCSFCYLANRAWESKYDALWLGFAGAIASVFTEVGSYSVDTLNSRMKVNWEKNMRVLLRKLVKEEGVKSLFRGISLIYYGIITYAVVYFSLYSTLKKNLRPYFSE